MDGTVKIVRKCDSGVMQKTDALLALPVGLNNPREQGQAQAIGHAPAMFGT